MGFLYKSKEFDSSGTEREHAGHPLESFSHPNSGRGVLTYRAGDVKNRDRIRKG
jgi:hypothetical protein